MTTTHLTDRTEHPLDLMKRGDDAFNNRDVDAMDAVHHPDMVAHVAGSAEPIRGRAAHGAAMMQMFRAFPDVHVHNDPYPVKFGNGDWITVVTRVSGTFSGDMTLPDGTTLSATGRTFDLDFSTTAKWDGDQLVEEYVFWDTTLQAQQIGLG